MLCTHGPPFTEPERHRALPPAAPHPALQARVPASAHHPSVPSSPHPLPTYTPTHPPRAASETARVAWGTSPGLDWCCSGGMGA